MGVHALEGARRSHPHLKDPLTEAGREPLDLAAALGLARGGVDDADGQLGRGALERGVHERRPVVDIDVLGDTAGGQRRTQRGRQPDGVLEVAPAVPDDGARVVVDEANKNL
nr:hypothetical protein [Actinomadura madurae]